jgi:hypothetical protein
MKGTASPTADNSPPILRWYQWRLRSLFVVIFLAAVAMSCGAVTIQHARRQKAVVDWVEALGGTATCEPTRLGRLLQDHSMVSVTEIHLSGKRVNDVDLVHFLGLGELETLVLNKTLITDAGLARFEALNHLRMLVLSDTAITNAGLTHLSRLDKLEVLALDKTRLSDDGLVNLEGLTQLRVLSLRDTNVSDRGVVHLAGLTRLQELWLDGTYVTDRGLVHLEASKQLRILTLMDTNVTEKGVKGLRQALKKCHVGLGVRHSGPLYSPPALRERGTTKEAEKRAPWNESMKTGHP